MEGQENNTQDNVQAQGNVQDQIIKDLQNAKEQLTAPQNQQASGSVGSPTAQNNNPFDRFYIVELNFSGLRENTHATEDHILTAFYRLDKDAMNKLQYRKVQFYRACKSMSSFKINGKYVMPVENLPKFEQQYKEIELDFLADRNEIYRNLSLNWDTIVEEAFAKHPNLPFTREEIEEMRPSSPDFTTMNYDFRSFGAYLKELKGLSEMFADASSPELAKRLEIQKDIIMAQIRAQFQDKISELQNRVEKMKKFIKKKSKGFDKRMERIEKVKSAVIDMAEILGEKDAVEMQITGMLEALAAGMQPPDQPKQKAMPQTAPPEQMPGGNAIADAYAAMTGNDEEDDDSDPAEWESDA